MPPESRILVTGFKLLAALTVGNTILSHPHETNLTFKEDWKCYEEPRTIQQNLWRRNSFERPQIGQRKFARVPSWRGLAWSRNSTSSITSISQFLGERRPSTPWTGRLDGSEESFQEKCDSDIKGTAYVNSEAPLEDSIQGGSRSDNLRSQDFSQSIRRFEKVYNIENIKYNSTEPKLALASIGIDFQSPNNTRTGLISTNRDGDDDDEKRDGLQRAFPTSGPMDVGFVWTFHEECINMITKLLPLISTNPILRGQQEVLREDVGRLFLWGESFRNGKLDMVLSQSEELRDTVLEFITAIGLLVTEKLSPQLIEAGSDPDISARVDDFKALIGKAQSLTKNGDFAQDDLTFESDSETSSETSEQVETNIAAEIGVYVNCLMDLLPSMDHVLALETDYDLNNGYYRYII